jgi:hypothetical protein
MTEPIAKDWRELCFAAENEKDSKKLDLLIQALIQALGALHESWTSTAPSRSLGPQRQRINRRSVGRLEIGTDLTCCDNAGKCKRL